MNTQNTYIEQQRQLMHIQQAASSRRKIITWSLISILLICIIALLSSILFFPKTSPGQTTNHIAPLTQTQEREVPATTTLELIPAKTTLTIGEQFDVAVIIHSNSNSIGIVQLELQYDPTTIVIDKITQGTFFNKPAVYMDKEDKVKGKIIYIIGSFEDKKGTGTVATISARALKRSGGNKEVISILPSSLATQPKVTSSILKSRTGALVTIQ